MMSTPYATLQYGHSEEMGLLRETVHQFATEEIAPRAADIDRDNDHRLKGLKIGWVILNRWTWLPCTPM